MDYFPTMACGLHVLKHGRVPILNYLIQISYRGRSTLTLLFEDVLKLFQRSLPLERLHLLFRQIEGLRGESLEWEQPRPHGPRVNVHVDFEDREPRSCIEPLPRTNRDRDAVIVQESD